MKSSLCRTLFAACLALPCAAQAGALEQLKAFAASVKSARGEFSQRQVKAGGQSADTVKITSQSSGAFVFSRPGRFVWDYRKPYEQQLLSDGDKLYIWDKDLNQVTVRKLGDSLASSPAAILFGSNDLDKYFVLKESTSRDGLDWLELTPKTPDSQFSRIGIGFRGNLPEAMELRDAFSNVTLLTFSKLEKNPALAAGQFQFVAPKGVDVVGQ